MKVMEDATGIEVTNKILTTLDEEGNWNVSIVLTERRTYDFVTWKEESVEYVAKDKEMNKALLIANAMITDYLVKNGGTLLKEENNNGNKQQTKSN